MIHGAPWKHEQTPKRTETFKIGGWVSWIQQTSLSRQLLGKQRNDI